MALRPLSRTAAVFVALLALAHQPWIAQGQGPNPAQSPALPTEGWRAEGKNGAVAAGGRDSVEAGLEALKAGGNAADAAVVTILALSVTDATAFCFGGEVPILVYDARSGTVAAIAGQGAAPRLATPEHFAGRPELPPRGVEVATVPAALDACLVTLDRFGTWTFARAVAPTLALLDRSGQPWHPALAKTLRELVEAESRSPSDRSRGLRLVADAFYRGPIARRIDAWSRSSGGLLRYADLATHVTRVEEPVTASYRGHTVVKCGPWTQGPYLLQALRLLEGFDLKAIGRGQVDSIHLTVEALKLALADRDSHYGDPLFSDVPLEALLSPSYAEARRRLIDPARASLARRPGDPRGGHAELDPASDPAAPATPSVAAAVNDTTTCVVADKDGNVVAATPSGWSGVLAGDTGVWLGSRLQSFKLWPGHPNRLEPGKRPRITLTPTLVLKDGKPVLAVSVAGGDNQDQMTLQLLLDRLDYGLDPAKSVVAPRFMTDHLISSFSQSPTALGRLRINPDFGPDVLKALGERGHRLAASKGIQGAAPCVIAIDPASHTIRTSGDPRAGRHALAY